MHTAAEKMADKFRPAIARVYRIGDSKGIKHKKCNAMAFPGLCFDSWSVRLSNMGHIFSDNDSSEITPTHVLHLGFLKSLLGVKKSTDDTHCVLRETGQMPIISIGLVHHTILEQFTHRSDTGLTRFT